MLSDAAIAKVRRDTMNGRYNDRADAKEPPLMVPATDTSQYSQVCVNPVYIRTAADVDQWCSFCNDVRDCLLLCAGLFSWSGWAEQWGR